MGEPRKPVDLAGGERDYLVTRRGSDVLMVSFGGRYEKFNFVNLAARNAFDGLFLRDWNSDWYLSGIRGVSDAFEEVCAFIREVMLSAPYRRCIFIGQSSGGYASLRFALEINPDVCLAFAPQTRPLPDDHRPLRQHADFELSRPSPGIEDLAELYLSKPPSCRVQIHLCDSEADNPPDAYFWDDWAHIDGFREVAGVEIVRHPCSAHPVAECLTNAGKLDKIVQAMLAE